MDPHQKLKQEYLRTQRAAQAAWVEEQARHTDSRATKPSQVTPANLYNYKDPDKTARNPPRPTQEHLGELTPAQFEQEQMTIWLAMQGQPRHTPTPAPEAVPGLHACRLAGQASRSASQKVAARPLSRLERDFNAGSRAKVEWLFTKFYWKHIWTSIWSAEFVRNKPPAVQWVIFMQCITLFVIMGTPYFALDTVWLLTTLAFHGIKRMLGISSTTARIQSIQSAIHSRFLSLTNRTKHAWARLQYNLETVVNFCSQRSQSSSHHGWLIPILVILIIFEPRLIFSDLIPSMMVAGSEWTSGTMRLLITRFTILLNWTRDAWTTIQATVIGVSSLTGWILSVIVLLIISGARYGWISTQSLKNRVSLLTRPVLNTTITWTTAGTRTLLSATGSMNRAFTSATTRAPNAQIPWLRIQAQDDDDGEEDSASGLSSISRTVGRCTKPVFQTIVKWVLLITSLLVTPTTETGGFWSTLLQFILKISLVADLIATIILPFIKWIKGVPSLDQRESVSLLEERNISISDISDISEPYYNDILLAEDSTYQLLVQLPGSRLGEDDSNEQDSSGSSSQQEESSSDSDTDSQASDISSSVSLTPSARLIMAEVAVIERGNQSLTQEHPARYTEESDSSQSRLFLAEITAFNISQETLVCNYCTTVFVLMK